FIHGLRSARLSAGCAPPVATFRGPAGANMNAAELPARRGARDTLLVAHLTQPRIPDVFVGILRVFFPFLRWRDSWRRRGRFLRAAVGIVIHDGLPRVPGAGLFRMDCGGSA